MPIDLSTYQGVRAVTVAVLEDEAGDRWDCRVLPRAVSAVPRHGALACRVPLVEPTPGLLLAAICNHDGARLPLAEYEFAALREEFPAWAIAAWPYERLICGPRWSWEARRRDYDGTGPCLLIRGSAAGLWGDLAAAENRPPHCAVTLQ